MQWQSAFRRMILNLWFIFCDVGLLHANFKKSVRPFVRYLRVAIYCEVIGCSWLADIEVGWNFTVGTKCSSLFALARLKRGFAHSHPSVNHWWQHRYNEHGRSYFVVLAQRSVIRSVSRSRTKRTNNCHKRLAGLMSGLSWSCSYLVIFGFYTRV